MLHQRVAKFRKSDHQKKLATIQICVEWIQARWDGDAGFDYPEVEKVCSPL